MGLARFSGGLGGPRVGDFRMQHDDTLAGPVGRPGAGAAEPQRPVRSGKGIVQLKAVALPGEHQPKLIGQVPGFRIAVIGLVLADRDIIRADRGAGQRIARDIGGPAAVGPDNDAVVVEQSNLPGQSVENRRAVIRLR